MDNNRRQFHNEWNLQSQFQTTRTRQPRHDISTKVHVTKNDMNYDMIIGRDLLRELKIDILFSTQTIQYNENSIPMKDRHCTESDAFYIQEPDSMEAEMKRLRDILDCKYQPADLAQVAKSCENLTQSQQKELHKLLIKHEKLFDGSLGRMKSEPYDIKLKPNTKPYHAKRFPIPHIHEAKLKAEVQ